MEPFFAVQQFARCVNDSDKPSNHVGDWPVAGTIYAVVPRINVRTKQAQIIIVGFKIEKPHGAFSIERFASVAFICLN